MTALHIDKQMIGQIDSVTGRTDCSNQACFESNNSIANYRAITDVDDCTGDCYWLALVLRWYRHYRVYDRQQAESKK